MPSLATRGLRATLATVTAAGVLIALPSIGVAVASNASVKSDPEPTYEPVAGLFGTDTLVARAEMGRSQGWSEQRIARNVYAPFIVAGRSSFSDTWGAPRTGPAPGQVRTHEGQDVFCDYGDPVLAPEAGTLSMSNGGLGGMTSRVHRSDGSYWYLTHLSGFNTELSTGDDVAVGDIIGYCGNSGNAAGTPAHVHFGWYSASGEALNPMESLMGWLATAEGRKLATASSGKGDSKTKKVKTRKFSQGRQATISLSIPSGRSSTGNRNRP